MVVRTKNVYRLVKASCNELVVVICNIGYKVGRDTVCTDKNSVLIVTEIGRLEPDCTVLFVCLTLFCQHINNLLYRTALVKRAFSEPCVVYDTVFCKIFLKSVYVERQSIFYQCGLAAFLICVYKLVAVYLIEIICVFDYVNTLVNVLGHREVFFIFKYLAAYVIIAV